MSHFTSATRITATRRTSQPSRSSQEQVPTLVGYAPGAMAGSSHTAVTKREHGGSSPAAVEACPSGSGAPSEQLTFETPEQVLYASEIMRGKLWVGTCVVLSVAALVAGLLIDDPGPAFQRLLLGGGGFLLFLSLGGVWMLHGEPRYHPDHATPFGYACIIAVIPALVFFGWFSPVVLLLALGGLVFSMGHTTRAVVVMASFAVAVHLGVGLSEIFGWLPRGAVSALTVDDLPSKLICLAGCEGMIVMAFVFGRRFRAHALVGIEAHAQVVRDNARREAQLEEAVAELNRVRRVGDPGRYTGISIGSFDVGVVLGRGGMGEVYEAVHKTTGELAALKVLAVAGIPDEQTLARFRREIDLAAQLSSPHIVRVLERSPEGSPVLYLAMERLQGCSLSEELREKRRPPTPEVLYMLKHVARGVSAAHQRGIVHRDLKPQNLFHHRANGEDVWKLLDFGIARWSGLASSLTGDAIVGTPSYMSPEQALGRDVDHRSDIFSLGCVAYRALTGRPAFRGGGAETVYAILHEMPPRPSALAALPPEVDSVLALALAKSADDRFDRVQDLAEALSAACAGGIDPALKERATRVLAQLPWT